MNPFVQVLEPRLEVCLVVPPRHAIHPGPDSHRLERASLPWRTSSRLSRYTWNWKQAKPLAVAA
jgi:hypothetical protein